MLSEILLPSKKQLFRKKQFGSLLLTEKYLLKLNNNTISFFSKIVNSFYHKYVAEFLNTQTAFTCSK